jgi:hypothetical protein
VVKLKAGFLKAQIVDYFMFGNDIIKNLYYIQFITVYAQAITKFEFE